MLHHVSLPVSDLSRAGALYDSALAALGYRRVFGNSTAIGYGVEEGRDKLALLAIPDAQAAGPGFHLAFSAPSQSAVAAFHAAALSAGATDNGPPGLRPAYGATYFAAFIIDLDGHRLEAVHK